MSDDHVDTVMLSISLRNAAVSMVEKFRALPIIATGEGSDGNVSIYPEGLKVHKNENFLALILNFVLCHCIIIMFLY